MQRYSKMGGGSAEEHLPQLLVNSVHSIVLVDPDQEPGCLQSQAIVGLRSRGLPQWSCSCSCSVILPVSPSIFSDSVAIVRISSRVTRQLRSISSCLCSYRSLGRFPQWFWCVVIILVLCLLPHAFKPWAPFGLRWLPPSLSLMRYPTSSWVACQPLNPPKQPSR